MQEILLTGEESALAHGYIPGHLVHPLLIGVGCDSGQTYLSGFQVNEEQHIVGDQAFQGEHFCSEEV